MRIKEVFDMRRMLPTFVVLALFSLGAQAGGLQPAAMGMSSLPAFDEVDKNMDGAINLDEARRAEVAKAAFDSMDKDGDGQLSKREYGKTADKDTADQQRGS